VSDFGPELEQPFFPDEELFMTRVCNVADFTQEAAAVINNKLTAVRDSEADSVERKRAGLAYIDSAHSLERHTDLQIKQATKDCLAPEHHLGVNLFVRALPHIRNILESKQLGIIPEDTTEFTQIPVPAGMETWAVHMLVIASRALALPVSTTVHGKNVHVTPGMGLTEGLASLRRAA
jgi:hypothetical protein